MAARLIVRGLTSEPALARIAYVAVAPRLKTARLEKALVAAGGYVRFLWEMTRAPDIVHVHSSRSGDFWRNAPLIALGVFCRRRVVLHIHPSNAYADDLTGTPIPIRRVKLALVNAATLVMTPSAEGARALGVAGVTARLEVLPNPVDQEWFVSRPLAERDVDITFLGWLTPEKGIFDLLAALAGLEESHPGLTVAVYGPYGAAEVRASVKELGLDNVTVGEWIDGEAKRQLLSRSRVVALPSYSEGLPMVLLEALASGTPVVATRVGGIPEAIPDGQVGLLVSPGNRADLEVAVARLLENDHLWCEMHHSALHRAGMYNLDNVARRLSDIYRELCVGVQSHGAAQTNHEEQRGR